MCEYEENIQAAKNKPLEFFAGSIVRLPKNYAVRQEDGRWVWVNPETNKPGYSSFDDDDMRSHIEIGALELVWH